MKKYLDICLNIKMSTRIFKALNDQTRREILDLLRNSDLNAGDIAQHFNITKASISNHLDILMQAQLIEQRREGQFLWYSLNTTVLDEILIWLQNLKSK